MLFRSIEPLPETSLAAIFSPMTRIALCRPLRQRDPSGGLNQVGLGRCWTALAGPEPELGPSMDLGELKALHDLDRPTWLFI